MKMCGDWWFWIKICQKARVAFIAQPLNYFRNHSEMSRKHNSLEKKKHRILEEVKIRNYLSKNLAVKLSAKNDMILERWYNVSKMADLLGSDFYKVASLTSSKSSLVLNFLRYKLKQKFN